VTQRGAASSGAAAAGQGGSDYPGADLGLPEAGPGSVARTGSRLGAIVIDWLLCWVIAAAITGSFLRTGFWTLLVFAAQDYVLTALLGLTIGKRLLRIRVTRADGRIPGPGWAAVRTGLLVLVIPALISDRNLRGLHDRAADTVVVRL
jgi:uncharacterized RDD family membrane protein YckC